MGSGPCVSKSIDDDEDSRSWFNSATDKQIIANQGSSTLYDGTSTAGLRLLDYNSFDQPDRTITEKVTGQQQHQQATSNQVPSFSAS